MANLLTTKQQQQRQDFLEELAALMRKYSVTTTPGEFNADGYDDWEFTSQPDERGVSWALDRYDIDDMFIGGTA